MRNIELFSWLKVGQLFRIPGVDNLYKKISDTQAHEYPKKVGGKGKKVMTIDQDVDCIPQ